MQEATALRTAAAAAHGSAAVIADGGVISRGDGGDRHGQCQCDAAGGSQCRRQRRFELPPLPLAEVQL